MRRLLQSARRGQPLRRLCESCGTNVLIDEGSLGNPAVGESQKRDLIWIPEVCSCLINLVLKQSRILCVIQ